MATHADYETLLRSMSALSQQFSQRTSRPQGTPPNPLYNRQSCRSRVHKPRSTNVSPSIASGQRRRAPTAHQMQRPFSYVNPQLQSYIPPQRLDNLNDYFQGPSSDADRPRSWHADMNMSSSCTQPSMITNNGYVSGYMQTIPMWNNMSVDMFPMYTACNAMPWMQSQLDVWGPHASVNAQDASSFAPEPTFDQSQETSAFNVPAEAIDDEEDDTDDDDEPGNALVGMGLYDKSPSSRPGLLLGTGGSALEDKGKGLRLEEGWAPPADQVPETEADEGSDTPVTAECKDWNPEEADFSQSATYYDDVAMPQVRQSNDTVFDDNGNIMTEEMFAAQDKAFSMGWYGLNQWTHPGYGYYTYY